MSTIYDTEPQPTASVVLHTTAGEIAVELFAKQTPLASRNFLQHCLDGYYDGTLFHRLVPGFVVQGGDPTGTGHGGESIYDGGALAGDLDPWPMDQRRGANAGPQGVGFKDEFHSRLKFNRRGLLGMANEGRPDTNGSQFFFTLDKADELNNRNTLFGRVAGPTIYNLTKIGQGEVQPGTDDRPLYPTKITRVEILTNPFADMRKTERDARRAPKQPQEAAARPDDKKKGAKRKKGVNKNLLSFGNDIEEDAEADDAEAEADQPRKKSKKTKPEKDGGNETEKAEEEPEAKQTETRHKTTLPSRTGPEASSSSTPAARPLVRDDDEEDGSLSDSESDREALPQRRKEPSALEKTNAEIAALKASMRRTVPAGSARADEEDEKKSALEQLVPATATRGKKLSRKYGLSSHDQKTLNILGAFTSKLGQDANGHAAAKSLTPAPESEGTPAGEDGAEEGDGEVCDLHFIANCQSCRPWDKDEEGGGDGDSDGEDWMSHTLNCAADKLGKDLSYRKKAEEELIVIDPRERAQTLKDEKRAARDARGGSGGRGGRSWGDQARHAKMAQAAALMGRGAK